MAAFIYVVKCTLCKINANKKVDVKKKQTKRKTETYFHLHFYFILIDSSLNVLNNTRLQLKILFMF